MQPRTMPVWLRNLLAVCIILVFSFVLMLLYYVSGVPNLSFPDSGICLCHAPHSCKAYIHRNLSDHNKASSDKHKDDTFTQNFGQARKYGFIRGAYHYFIPKTDARKQADFFIRTVQLAKGDQPPVLDVETTGKQSPQELKTAVKTWLDRVEAHYGVKPILYTSYKFKKRYLSDSIFNAYPYWIAHYYVDSVRYEGKWHFWQHTDVGTVPGIEEAKRNGLHIVHHREKNRWAAVKFQK